MGSTWDRDGTRLGWDEINMQWDGGACQASQFLHPSAAKRPFSLQVLLEMLVFANTHTHLDEMDFFMSLGLTCIGSLEKYASLCGETLILILANQK